MSFRRTVYIVIVLVVSFVFRMHFRAPARCGCGGGLRPSVFRMRLHPLARPRRWGCSGNPGSLCAAVQQGVLPFSAGIFTPPPARLRPCIILILYTPPSLPLAKDVTVACVFVVFEGNHFSPPVTNPLVGMRGRFNVFRASYPGVLPSFSPLAAVFLHEASQPRRGKVSE